MLQGRLWIPATVGECRQELVPRFSGNVGSLVPVEVMIANPLSYRCQTGVPR
jgi:hypothetical protein